jgi:hypothetical protein
MPDSDRPKVKGRGSRLNPPNRFGGPHYEPDFEHLEHDAEYLESLRNPHTEYVPDHSKSIVTENDSPDVGFRFSINPYRGCLHGCAYCYARQTHEYLGFNAGLDFETKIMVKEDAPELFREFLASDTWRAEPIALSGVTDCYQPAWRDRSDGAVGFGPIGAAIPRPHRPHPLPHGGPNGRRGARVGNAVGLDAVKGAPELLAGSHFAILPW